MRLSSTQLKHSCLRVRQGLPNETITTLPADGSFIAVNDTRDAFRAVGVYERTVLVQLVPGGWGGMISHARGVDGCIYFKSWLDRILIAEQRRNIRTENIQSANDAGCKVRIGRQSQNAWRSHKVK